jgi:hypothetical protein
MSSAPSQSGVGGTGMSAALPSLLASGRTRGVVVGALVAVAIMSWAFSSSTSVGAATSSGYVTAALHVNNSPPSAIITANDGVAS